MSDHTQQQQDYSLADLDAAVEAGKITQQQRDQIFQTQVERRAQALAREEAESVVARESAVASLDGKLQEYANVAPELLEDGSPLRRRVEKEFNFLVANGSPRNLATELAAVRGVMGDATKARAAKANPDAYADTYMRQVSPRARREDAQWNRLDPRQRDYFERQITKGIYADRAAALAELTWQRKPKEPASN